MKSRILIYTLAMVVGTVLVTSYMAVAPSSRADEKTGAHASPSSQSQADARRIERQFNAGMGKKLDVNLDTGGSINITGWDREVVEVSALLGGRDGANTEVTFNETAAGVEIRSRYTGSRKNYSTDLHFDIKVPRRFDAKLESMGGGIKIDNVEGEIRGQTMGGELDLSNLKGRLNLTTMGGEITLKQSQVDGRVETMGGKVLVEDVVGDVKGSSMGGSVIYRNVTNSSGVSTGDEVRISSMGGDINVDDAPSGANVTTMGGDISIRSASKHVKAKTMGGDILIRAVDGWVRATTMGGDVDVRMVGNPGDERRDVEITSMSGDITLTIPEGLSMDVYIELARTKNKDDIYKITSDFALQQRQTDEWVSEHHGTPRKYTYGTAQIAGGKNKIVIKTINGNVRLKKG